MIQTFLSFPFVILSRIHYIHTIHTYTHTYIHPTYLHTYKRQHQPPTKTPPVIIGIDEMVIASNANIGGPATAAAMATSSSLQRPDLGLPATVTGTVGYALATALGVTLFKLLNKR